MEKKSENKIKNDKNQNSNTLEYHNDIRIKELETEIKQITLDVQTVKMLKDTINIINRNIEASTVRFKKEMPAICPLCGNNTI